MFGSSSSSSSLSSSSSSPLSGLFPASNSNPPPPARSSWLHDPYVSIPITCSAVLGASLFWRRYFRRIPSAAYVTPRTLSSRKSIRGYVTAIGDADGFRLYHTPGVWLFARLWRVPKDKKVLKDKTISIRIAGVDAPECAHFGKPAQPFSEEALSLLTDMVLHRNVKIEMLSKDQYARIVSMVYVRNPIWWPLRKNVSLEMLKAGLAEVYVNSGAEYGTIGKAKLEAAESKAKRKKRGMWSQKASKYESPAEYKRRTLS
ncbi:MAG: putative endonuclease lcl3 [Cyphobasidiales sp. Tagirdzhanova-0007]|nr:MAG: putative endonuclease lcl3 [Cyphobasidiales sp. Tagirdzhanova-0007]